MNIELLTIGNELLLGFTIDTNAAEFGQRVAEAGFHLVRHTTVDDQPAQIQTALQEAMARSPVVVTTGGLGPTRDDRTRAAIAGTLGMELEFDQAVWDDIVARYQGRRSLPASNRAQAMVPRGGEVLRNRWGTAPGLWLPHPEGVVVMLPGVPHEMRNLLRHEVLPRLKQRFGSEPSRVVRSRTLRTAGIGESALAEQVGDIEAELEPLSLAWLPQTGSVDLRLTAWEVPAEEADILLERGVEKLRERLGRWYYGEEQAELAGVLLAQLAESGLSLAVAESCTGGMLGERLTSIPGSSRSFLGGVISYANRVKRDLLGVSESVLLNHGAVSSETAAAMARGVSESTGSDLAISITGIAGPEGGSEKKPVGTVWFGFLVHQRIVTEQAIFVGERDEIRHRAVVHAMMRLRQKLMDG